MRPVSESHAIAVQTPRAAAPEDLQHTHCVVTGASSGIGLEVARGLAARGCTVTLGCRDLTRCARARDDILAGQDPPGRCECSIVDLSDAESIRAFALAVRASLQPEQRLLLVNNAGVMGVPVEAGADGHLWPNHYGHFLLTRLLLPVMPPSSRIVVVASRAHFQGAVRVGPDGAIDPSWGGGHWYLRYARSKLCNVLFAAELRRRLSAAGVDVFAVSPGRVGTGIYRRVQGPAGGLLDWIAQRFFLRPSDGADAVLHAALAADPADGLYWHRGHPQQPSRAARDPDLAAEVWEASERQVGLHPSEAAVSDSR